MGRLENVRRRRGRRFRTVAGIATAVGALTLSGCTAGGANAPAGDPSVPATAPPSGQDKLARFYSQQLSWQDCAAGDEKAQCAWVEVPVDYADPDGATMKLRALKVPASGKKQGSLLVNPGGPGGSAVDYARAADLIVTPTVRKSFDVVGLDPRGVGQSSPITCVGDAQLDEMLGVDPTPDTEKEHEESRTLAREFGEACEKKYPELLPHLSTADAARDMDVMRAAVGDAKLTYLGKSYGTFLGATYAQLFPQRVGRLVLDGAIAPELTSEELDLGQAVGFETATRAYVAHCVAEKDCPLGDDVESGMTDLQDMLKKFDTNPLPVSGDARVTELTEGWASTGFARAMYDPEIWDGLTDAIRGAKEGDGTLLFGLAKEYADRADDGTYAGNIMQVISAVNCLDRPSRPTSDAEARARLERFEEAAPTWGASMAAADITCETWPVRSGAQPQKISAAGAGPIVVIGTTRDPATPYEWAQKLAAELEDGRLITYDGDGHTAYMRSNDCVDNAVDGFLTQGKAPDDGLKC